MSKKKKDIVSPKLKSKYIICVDRYDYSKMALSFGCRLALNNQCSIELLHVIEPANFQTLGAVAEKMKEEKRTEIEELMKKYSESVNDLAGQYPSITIKEGDIEEQIIDAVKSDKQIDLLIMGTSPESGSSSKLLPELISHLHDTLMIPMIIVPGNITKERIEALT